MSESISVAVRKREPSERKELTRTESFVIPSSRNKCPTTDEARRDALRITVEISDEIESSIVSAVMRPLAVGETHLVAAQQREHALRAIFSGLTVAQALAISRRLDLDRENDRIAVAFRRFTSERRQRLRDYLADTRRRQAVSRASCEASARR